MDKKTPRSSDEMSMGEEPIVPTNPPEVHGPFEEAIDWKAYDVMYDKLLEGGPDLKQCLRIAFGEPELDNRFALPSGALEAISLYAAKKGISNLYEFDIFLEADASGQRRPMYVVTRGWGKDCEIICSYVVDERPIALVVQRQLRLQTIDEDHRPDALRSFKRACHDFSQATFQRFQQEAEDRAAAAEVQQRTKKNAIRALRGLSMEV